MYINTTWHNFTGKIKELRDKFIPSKSISGKAHKPWITRNIKTLHHKRDKLYKIMKRTGKTEDISKYMELRAKIQKAETREYCRYIENIIECGQDSTAQPASKQKRFWSYIKSLRKDSGGVSPLKSDGIMYNNPKDKANILNKQYQSVFTRETPNIPDMEGPTYPSMPDITVDTRGVLKLLKNIKPNKASGPDMIAARLLRELAEEIAPLLTAIFQKSIRENRVPDEWKLANVTAVFKKGDRHKASNYRPVSLTCICSKIQEHIMVSNILKHLDKYSILTDCQHGFRSRRSCESQLLLLTHDLARGLDAGEQQDLVILDFSKAFDKVPHLRLLAKLNHCGIRGDTKGWIQSFLCGRSQQVIIGENSEKAPVISGVPQGTVLGPLLFLIFINDLPKCVTSNVRLFADDCILYRPIKGKDDHKILQEDLSNLATWEHKWGMQFHPEKCNVMSISRAKSPSQFAYNLKGHTLDRCSSTKYLGVMLSQNLDWSIHH